MVLYMRKYGTGGEEEVGEEKQEIKKIRWVWRGKWQRGNFKDYLKYIYF